MPADPWVTGRDPRPIDSRRWIPGPRPRVAPEPAGHRRPPADEETRDSVNPARGRRRAGGPQSAPESGHPGDHGGRAPKPGWRRDEDPGGRRRRVHRVGRHAAVDPGRARGRRAGRLLHRTRRRGARRRPTGAGRHHRGREPCWPAAASTPSCTSRRNRWSASRCRTRRCTGGPTSAAPGCCSTRWPSTGCPDWCSPPPPPPTASRTTVPITEDAPTRPTNTYGATKLAVDMMITGECAATDLAAVSLRYFNVAGAAFGAGERHGSRNPPDPHRAGRRGRRRRDRLTIFGDDWPTPDGTPIRDYVHVADLARAHVLALDRRRAGRAPDLQPRQRRRVQRARGAGHRSSEVTGTPVPVTVGPAPGGRSDPPGRLRRARRGRALGWTPVHSLDRDGRRRLGVPPPGGRTLTTVSPRRRTARTRCSGNRCRTCRSRRAAQRHPPQRHPPQRHSPQRHSPKELSYRPVPHPARDQVRRGQAPTRARPATSPGSRRARGRAR